MILRIFNFLKGLFSKTDTKAEVKKVASSGTFLWVGKPRQTPKFK